MVLVENTENSVRSYRDNEKGVNLTFAPHEKKELNNFNGADGFRVVKEETSKKEQKQKEVEE